MVADIYFQAGSSSDFTVTPAPALPVYIPPPNGAPNWIEVEVTYTPTVPGPSSAILAIISSDPDESMVEVPLWGEGIETQPVSIEGILNFFNKSVEDGTLLGIGPGSSAEAHISVLRHMLLLAAKLISDDLADVACQQLEFVYDRCDGESPPPDFVEGEDVPELAAMIMALMLDLGCE